MAGYIIVPRKIFSGTFKEGKANETFAFIDLLQMAAFGEMQIGDVTLQRGEAFASIRYLSRRWDWSPTTVQKFLAKLEEGGYITRIKDDRKSVISINDYETYQSIQTSENVAKKPQKPPKNASPDSAQLKESVERVYKAYPSSTTRGHGKVYIRSEKDKEKIRTLLKNGKTEAQLLDTISRYKAEHPTGEYLKDFATFLNNLPDYSDDALFPTERRERPTQKGGFIFEGR